MDELDEQLQQLHVINGRIQQQQQQKQQLQQQHQQLHQQNVMPEIKNVTRLVQSIEDSQRNLNSNNCNIMPSLPPISPSPSAMGLTYLNSAKNFTSLYGENENLHQQPHLQKKVGPLVPPKPNKKSTSYNQGTADYEKYAAPVLLRKNQFGSSSSGLGLSLDQQMSSLVTLDNPLVLEQQLEALEYHKKQLEKRNKLPQQQHQQQQKCSGTLSSLSPLRAIPKLSSTSLFSASSLDVNVKHNNNNTDNKKRHYTAADNNTYVNMSSNAIRQHQHQPNQQQPLQQQQHQQQQQQQQSVKDFNKVYSNVMACFDKSLEYTAKPSTATAQSLSNNTNLSYLIEGATKAASPTLTSAHEPHNNTIYSNLLYDSKNDGRGGSFANIPTSMPTTIISTNNHNNNNDGDDEGNTSCENDGTKEFYDVSHEDEMLPPPPSPVSSSYSELRRASEIYKARQIINNSHYGVHQMQCTVQQLQQPEQQQQLQQLPLQQSGVTGEKFAYYGDNSIYSNEYRNYNMQTGQSNTTLSASDYYGGGYGGFSQSSSCYESIYEPINPRPPSQLSSNASHNFVMYAGGGDMKNGCGNVNFNVNANTTNTGFLSKSTSSNLTLLDSVNGSGCSSSSGRDGGGGGTSNCSGSNPSTYSNAININNHGQRTNLVYRTSLQSPSSSSLEDNVQTLSKHFVEQSMDSGVIRNNVGGDGGNNQDLENYGTCYKCQQRVIDENSGCTAMDQIYHIACFTCVQCQINLQGKAFYALEGKPYCEYDYLQTLEKCSVCMKPILERILRATGKPYHPQCFTCVVCMKSLDGIPFTVDATNQNYCIEDFHKKFAPRCCVCKNPIMPESGEEETVRVVALDRSFHFECYKCEDCGLLLSSEAEGRGCYPLDDHVLCKSCNAKRVQMLTSRMITEL